MATTTTTPHRPRFHFDIDDYLNPYIPASQLHKLPTWLSRWLGYRAAPPPKPPQYLVWFWSWVGAFCGLNVIMAVFGQAQYFLNLKVPILVASYVRRCS